MLLLEPPESKGAADTDAIKESVKGDGGVMIDPTVSGYGRGTLSYSSYSFYA
jgi:hypothetical protein